MACWNWIRSRACCSWMKCSTRRKIVSSGCGLGTRHAATVSVRFGYYQRPSFNLKGRLLGCSGSRACNCTDIILLIQVQALFPSSKTIYTSGPCSRKIEALQQKHQSSSTRANEKKDNLLKDLRAHSYHSSQSHKSQRGLLPRNSHTDTEYTKASHLGNTYLNLPRKAKYICKEYKTSQAET